MEREPFRRAYQPAVASVARVFVNTIAIVANPTTVFGIHAIVNPGSHRMSSAI